LPYSVPYVVKVKIVCLFYWDQQYGSGEDHQTGEHHYVSVDDPRLLTGEIVSVWMGKNIKNQPRSE
jgi:hypothetical protein